MSQMTREEALQRIVLAGAIKPGQASEAKATLPERSLFPVDVAVRIRASISKGVGQPERQEEAAAHLDPWCRGVMGEVLARCKVDKRTLKRALKAALQADACELARKHQALIDEVEAVADDLADEMPPVTCTRGGRAAPVRVEGVQIEVLPPVKAAA